MPPSAMALTILSLSTSLLGYSGKSMVHMHACAVGSEAVLADTFETVNFWSPLKPCSLAKPPTGGFLEPVTKCRSAARCSELKECTTSQNQRTCLSLREYPPEHLECLSQSSASTYGSPAMMLAKSEGASTTLSPATVLCEMREWKPSRNAFTCFSIQPCRRHSHTALTYSSLFSSVTRTLAPFLISSTRSPATPWGTCSWSAPSRSSRTSVKSRSRGSTGFSRMYLTLNR
mmetsp:Transcript_11871/g.16441  ORF Transcript_11871/g.16441 Transcript_11871/m.16441 type:complete len:231 (-) Transcript_11871:186-878(-)